MNMMNTTTILVNVHSLAQVLALTLNSGRLEVHLCQRLQS